MKNRPSVSIIIPTYNREKLLPRSINSVLNQTYKDWELIIVDDRSTDNTKELIKKYMEKDKRIKYVKNKHKQGPAGARNQGIEKAEGEYIAFLDSDDEWKDFHLKKMIYYLEKYPEKLDLIRADVLVKNRIKVNRDILDLSKYSYHRLEKSVVFNTNKLFDAALINQMVNYTQTIVCKKEVLENIKFDEDLFVTEDYFFILECAYNKIKIGHLKDFHLIHWIHESNMTGAQIASRDMRLKRRLSWERYYLKILEKFKPNHGQKRIIKNKLANLYFWTIAYNIYLPMKDHKKAKEYFLKGLRLKPFDSKMWKTYIKRRILEVSL